MFPLRNRCLPHKCLDYHSQLQNEWICFFLSMIFLLCNYIFDILVSSISCIVMGLLFQNLDQIFELWLFAFERVAVLVRFPKWMSRIIYLYFLNQFQIFLESLAFIKLSKQGLIILFLFICWVILSCYRKCNFFF
jgi:hypothetical protein